MERAGTIVHARTGVGERRLYPRLPLRVAVKLESELRSHGFAVCRSTLPAVTVNISRGGVLVRADRLVPAASSCRVRFVAGELAVTPLEVPGEVCWTRAAEGAFLIGIRFDSPLAVLAQLAPR